MRVGDTPIFATELYDYEQLEIPATHTVETYIHTMERIVLDAEKRFMCRVALLQEV